MTIARMLMLVSVAGGVACSLDKPVEKKPVDRSSYQMGVALSVTYRSNPERVEDVSLRPAFVMDVCDEQEDVEACRRGFKDGLRADLSLLHYPPLVTHGDSAVLAYARAIGKTTGQLTISERREGFLRELVRVAAERKDDLDGR